LYNKTTKSEATRLATEASPNTVITRAQPGALPPDQNATVKSDKPYENSKTKNPVAVALIAASQNGGCFRRQRIAHSARVNTAPSSAGRSRKSVITLDAA